MPKVLVIFLSLLVSLLIVPHFSQVGATGLSVSTNQLTTQDTGGITVTGTGFSHNQNYNLLIKLDSSTPQLITTFTQDSYQPDASGNLTLQICPNVSGSYTIASSCNQSFTAGEYTVSIRQSGPGVQPEITSTTFEVVPITLASLTWLNTEWTSSTEIKFSVPLPDANYKTMVKKPGASSIFDDPNNKNGNNNGCINTQGGVYTYDLGQYIEGTYTVGVFKNSSAIPLVGCEQGALVAEGQFTINNSGTGSGTTTPGGTILAPVNAIPPPCQAGTPNCTSAFAACGNGSTGVQSALGVCIPTDPAGFVNGLVTFGIGIAGGVALLLMGMGAIGMITSQGNAEALKAAQGRFSSAMIGLLFIIFSVFLLKFIGVNILGILK